MVNKKVQAAGAAGALTVIVVWAANSAGVDVPPEVASAFTTLMAFLAGYIKTA
jgi:hypothetical protein